MMIVFMTSRKRLLAVHILLSILLLSTFYEDGVFLMNVEHTPRLFIATIFNSSFTCAHLYFTFILIFYVI